MSGVERPDLPGCAREDSHDSARLSRRVARARRDWNLWWRLGDWEARAEAIARTLDELRPDLVCLQEVRQEGDQNQAASLASRLGLQYAFATDRTEAGGDQGVALLSARRDRCRPLPVPPGVEQRNVALRAVVQGPRGPLLLATTHLIAYPHRSDARELQVRALVEFLAERERQPLISIVGGDFNAAPDSDEVRLLTGRRPPALPGWVFLDAWDTAGDESPGYTRVKTNPNSAPLLLPNLRWDDIFASWPSGPGGVGHPVRAEVVGSGARAGVVPSDHHAVLAEMRY